MKPGTKIEIEVIGGTNEAAKIIKPRAVNGGPPRPGYHLVRFDADGAKLWVHEESFVAC